MRMHERMEPQCHRYPSQTSGPNLPWEFSRKIPPGAPEGWHVSGVEIFQGPRLFVTFFDFDTVDGNQKSGEKSPVEGTVLYPSIYYVFTGCFLYPSPRR